MRSRYIQREDGKLVTPDEFYAEPLSAMVMPDIQPYQSMVDGSVIQSRSQHRAHLREHGCIELGNETAALLQPRARPDVDPQQRKELIVAQIQAFGGHENFKRALNKDIENAKWNSRK